MASACAMMQSAYFFLRIDRALLRKLLCFVNELLQPCRVRVLLGLLGPPRLRILDILIGDLFGKLLDVVVPTSRR